MINEEGGPSASATIASSSGGGPALPASAPPAAPFQQPTVHCLFCQCKLDLHPSLFGQSDDECASSSARSSSRYGPSDDRAELAAEFEQRLDLLSTRCVQSGNLLEMISDSNSPLEVPMCKKCATAVSSELNKQLAQLERECIRYKQSLDQLLQRRAECPFDKEAARLRLDALKSDEQDLLEQLTLLEEEERSLTVELEAKQAERKKIAEKDEELYRKLRDNHRTLIEEADEQRSLKLQIKHANEQLQRLTKMNVMDMLFHIWVDGEYGTISGFRLGRLRHDQVEWSEVNAALGQMTFLLKVISERIGLEFVGYDVVPCGSTSFIRVQKGGEELPLYGGGGWRPFGQPALDKALVAYMDCFCQVEQRLKQYFPPGGQLLPYRMLKDKIVDKDSQYLVKMQLNSEERWTKAMKCLLLNLKRVIGILITLPTIAAAQRQAQNAKEQSQQRGSGSGSPRTPTEPGPSSSSSAMPGTSAQKQPNSP